MTQPENYDANDCGEHADLVARPRVRPKNRAVISGWQAPAGVAAGTWDYVNRAHIGDGYDAFVQDEPLNAIDRQIISRYLPPLSHSNTGTSAARATAAPLVVDFGCGTGRTLLPLIRDGYRGLGVDLSESMLRNLREKMSRENGNDVSDGATGAQLTTLQANLVDLSCLSNDAADHAVCLLSTLGMIQGAAQRAKFLGHVRRVVRPNGLFVMHAHNYYYQWRHPGGLRWAVGNAWDAVCGRAEMGDRLATYRQVAGMFIHQFRRTELSGLLKNAGFGSVEWFGIEAGSEKAVPIKRWHNPFRFVGWIAVARS